MSDSPNDTAANPWAQLNAWREKGVPRDQWFARLKEAGLDDESAKVLINSVDGANPSVLPEALMGGGVNPLAPSSFTFSDVGMRGDAATVGLYWMAFGGTIGLMVAVFSLLVWVEVVESPPGALFVLARAMGTLAGLALGWGLFKVMLAVRVRRR